MIYLPAHPSWKSPATALVVNWLPLSFEWLLTLGIPWNNECGYVKPEDSVSTKQSCYVHSHFERKECSRKWAQIWGMVIVARGCCCCCFGGGSSGDDGPASLSVTTTTKVLSSSTITYLGTLPLTAIHVIPHTACKVFMFLVKSFEQRPKLRPQEHLKTHQVYFDFWGFEGYGFGSLSK